MVGDRPSCSSRREDGEACRATPLREEPFCFWHSPTHAEEAAAARKVGGQRRRREHTIAGAYDLEGLEDVRGLRRVLDITLADLLGIDNSISRARALIALVGSGAKLLEVGEHEERLEALEAVVQPREQPKLTRGRRR